MVERKVISGIFLTLLIMGILTLTLHIQPVRASGTIYIRADRSIDPPTAPISTVDNITYTFTDNIYDEIVVERSNIIIDSAGYTLQGTGAYPSKGIDLTGRSNVTIRNMEIEAFYYGIYLSESSGNTISGNNITANKWDGIELWDSSNNTVSGNNITNNEREGIYLNRSPNNYILGNNITANGDRGIYFLMYSSNSSIIGNDISNNFRGIDLQRSSNNIVSGNTVTNNYISGVSLYQVSSNNTIIENNITNNKGQGISLLDGSRNNNVYGNNITNNGYVGNYSGIYLYFSFNNTISGNIIMANHWAGVELRHSSSDNRFYHNNFIDNAQQVRSDGYANFWDYGYPSGGNYWSDYAGVDSNLDGIGDAPYVIDENNTDRYPLMHPWSPLPVHNINTGLGYATIQEAINANETLNEHTIFVEAGTYYENVVVNKGVLLIGEDRETTIIDGSGTDFVVLVRNANNVIISGFTIQRSGYDRAGIYLFRSNNGTVNNNILKNNDWAGIRLQFSDNNTISGNKITDNLCAIACGWSNMIIIKNNNWINNEFGMDLFHSNSSTIIRNNITENGDWAISILGRRNIVIENTIAYSDRGILFYGSRARAETCDNKIYHNNFISVVAQVETDDLVSFWDNGYPSGGNYWSDYVGVDVKSGAGKDLPGSDGIGDTSYVIDANNTDHYPLMNPYGAPPPQTYNLTITTTVGGITDPAPGTYSYTADSTVPVTAIPDVDYEFDYWELDGVNVGSANPYTIIMDNDHTLKAVFSPIPPPISASINPLSASINVGESVTFTSTVSGGYTPYSYQWYLNDAPVSSATSDTWAFTPTTSGIYYVYLKVTDDTGNTTQSETARITVTTVPVGGYSLPIKGYTTMKSLVPYLALLAILTVSLTMVRRKIHRGAKRP